MYTQYTDWQNVGLEQVAGYTNTPAPTVTAGNAAVTATGSPNYVNSTWVRMEVRVHFGTIGYTEAYWYDVNGNQLVHLVCFGVNVLPRSIGLRGASSAPSAIDSLALSDQGWIGPAPVLPTQTSRKGSLFMDIMG
jgi:hypothetical protein